MYTTYSKQCVAVQGRDPAEFAEKFNAETARLSKEGKVIEVEYMLDKNLAYIFYDEKNRIPESYRDEYIVKTDRVYKCGQCPYYMPNADRRIKSVPCIFAPYKVGPTSTACDVFYERFAPEPTGEGVSE